MSKKARTKQFEISTWRRRTVLFGMAAAAVFLSSRALNIQVLNNDFLQNQGDMRHLRVMSIPANRGMILDRNGEALAVSTQVMSVWANPQTLDLSDRKLQSLAKLLDKPVREIKSSVKERHDKEFVYLKRHIDPELAEKVAALDIDGIALQKEFRRYYPAGEVTGHLLGFTSIDDEGLEGMELALQDQLQAHPGQQRVIKDRLGRVVHSVDLLKAAQPGKDVQLSIDRRLQYIAYRELKAAVKEAGAKSGSMVLLDVRTGEVLAMVNQPSFNPNNRADYENNRFRNRAVTDRYEPGSTIKPFTIAAALQTHKYTPDTVIDTAPGYYRVGNSTIKDFRNYGALDLTHVIQKSSNVGVSKVALSMDKEKLWASLSDVGFGEFPGTRFPGETNGHLPFFGTWNNVEHASLSYGYGMSVSPMQLAAAYNVLANKGTVRPVTFLKDGAKEEGRKVYEDKTALSVIRMMETVVSEDGTGKAASVEGYRIAGKTGTAKKLTKDGYADDQYVAMFAGMAPASNPELVAVVVIDEPSNGDYYGGKVAAPVFSKVVSAALRLRDIPPDGMAQVPIRLAGALR